MRNVLRCVRPGCELGRCFRGVVAAAVVGVLGAAATSPALARDGYGPYRYAKPAFEVPEARGFGRLFTVQRPDDPESPGLPAQNSPFSALDALGRSMVEHGDPDARSGDSEMPSGYVYFGQFVGRDISLDTATQLGRKIRSDAELENARTPDLDLDNVYGNGPVRTPHLYNLPYLRVGRQIGDGRAPRYDLYRASATDRDGDRDGRGDPRDDENVIVAQIHAAFVAFHNRTTDILVKRYFADRDDRNRYCEEKLCDIRTLAARLPDGIKYRIFETARDHVTHYYHRIILDDYLPRLIGEQRLAELMRNGRDIYYPDGFRDEHGSLREPAIPVEFAAAAFRIGHSQVRTNYTLREGVSVNLFGGDERDGPLAFGPVSPRYVIDWRYFFDIDANPPRGFNYARRIDPLLSPSLHALASEEASVLSARDLVRGRVLHLPVGQDIAERILPALHARGVLDQWQDGWGERPSAEGKPWQAYVLTPDRRTTHFLGQDGTPLGYYVLQEAAIFGTRTQLQSIPAYTASIDQDDASRYDPIARLRHRGPLRDAAYEGGEGNGQWSDGGHRLGPVGGTIVGEVLTGLLEHYQEKTGKGLGFRPAVRGSASMFGTPDGRTEPKRRYMMRNFLMDAGVVDMN